ncbi:MAG: hypothetical protein A2V88_06180 [Elusimicrobia bacterium RBG_16_66_12]|nr:MAG: hypothetical protein A2V88_06180 [Elusimicrobia bacterium RBG_16_66_12]
MVEVSEAFLQQFVNGLRESAAAQQAAAASIEQVARAMETMTVEMRNHNDEITRVKESNRVGREDAVGLVNAHITAELTAREGWWRKLVVLAASALVVANILGVEVGRIIAALLGIK